MQMVSILFYRILLMMCYMLLGFFLYKKRLVTEVGSLELGKILLYLVLPSAIMKSFLVEYSPELAMKLLISFALAVGSLLLSIVLSYVVFKKRFPIENFGSAFSNAGFIGIPLIEGLWGSEAVFYVASYIALLNILQWTYGVFIMSGSKESIKVKSIATNPILISCVLGIILFFLPIPIPNFFKGVLGGVAAMNAPLAMIILGIYLAQLTLKELLFDRRVYISSFIRLIVSPLITLAFFCLLPKLDIVIKLAILLAASAPIGSNVAIFAHMQNLDYTKAVKNVCVSTLLSIVTMPLIAMIASLVIL